jgi:hypothetical protein
MLEGHNDRRSVNPMNADIVQERTAMNVYYHRNFTPNGEVETYHQTIDRLLAEKKIVKHNFKPKSAIVDEFVLDVNSEYFERNGGYEFAKKFYEEAYRYAVKEAGSENYIVSAVLHADERNKELSERLGRDVYHYHLHVVYVPVVEKEIKWTKRAGPELVGKVKEVIPQINHTDKWPRKKSGRGFINEYSKLQDRYHAHMTAAGYADLVRGERGSTAEHLDVLDFKIQQDNRRLADLDNQVKKKEARSEKLDDQIAVKEKAKATLAEVNAMGHGLPLVPGVHLTDDEAKRLKALAKKGVGVDKRADEYKKKITELEGDVRALSGQVDEWKRSYSAVARDREAHKQNYNRLWAEVKDFIPAIRSAPQALLAVAKEHNAYKNKEASR